MRRGVVAVLVAGCLWSATGVFARILADFGYTPITIAFVRMSLAFVFVFIILIVTGKQDLLRVRLKDIWCFIGSGISSVVLLNTLFSMSSLINTLSFATIMISTMPIFVVLLSAPIFGEAITSLKIQALAVAFAGCVLTSGIFGGGFVFSPFGFVIGLLSAIGYALYSIFSRFALNRGYDPLTVNAYSFGIGSIACVPFTDFALVVSSVADAPAKMSVILALNTIIASLLPYMLYTYGMKFMDTGRASILVSVEPVAATILGIFLYNELPGAISVIGIVLVLFGIALLNIPGGIRALPTLLKAPPRLPK